MKKKFLIIIPIFIFTLIFFTKIPSYASTYNKGVFEYFVPDKYESFYNEEYQDGFYTQYSYVAE